MKKLYCIISSLFSLMALQAQNSFNWDLNSYHNYPTYIDLQFKSSGVSLGDDYASGYAQNLSNSKISLTVKFIITDFCGNQMTEFWPGGLDLKPGESKSWGYAIGIKCKELKKSGSTSTGIASVTCQVTNFRNLTEEENKAKAESLKKEQQLAEEKLRKEKELALKKKEQQEKAEAEKKAQAEKEKQMKAEAERKAQAEKEAQQAKDEQALKEKEAKEEVDAKNESDKKEEVKKTAESKKVEKKPVTEEEKNEKWDRNVKASKLEADGDELRYKDASAAKEKYEQAQLINYTNRVEQKIKDLQTNLQVQAGVQAIQGIDKLADDLDPNGKTRFSEVFSGYDGFAGNNEKLNKMYPSNPWQLHFFGIRMSAIFLALELRLGYFNSPYYQFEVENNRNPGQVIDKIGIQQQAITTGLSGGLNFPFKNFCIYGLYGAEWVGLVTSKTMLEGKGYSFDENSAIVKFPDFVFTLSTGIDFRIPKTKIGLGFRYNLNKVQIKPRDNSYVKIKGGTDTRYQYYINKISPEKMEYTNFGIRMIWSWD